MALQISDKYKCIFVHVPKAAGSSIEQSHLFDDQRQTTGRHVGGHATALEFAASAPYKFDNYFKFSFVRNPYTRLLSAYSYLSKGGSGYAYDTRIHRKYFASRSLKLSSFCLELLSDQTVKEIVHLRPQCHFLCDLEGNIMVDCIGRVESFRKNLRFVCRRLGARPEFKHSLRSGIGHYSNYYTQDIAKHVFQIYRHDSEVLGYSRTVPTSAPLTFHHASAAAALSMRVKQAAGTLASTGRSSFSE